MSENPYRLARDIRGIGFRTADAIAMRLGIGKAAMIRLRAGVAHALTEAMDDGHCGLPAEELQPAAAELLEVPEDLVRTAMDEELAAGNVVADRVGEVLADIIASGAVAVVRLTEVFRQAAESRIIVNAHRINAGSVPKLDPPEAISDFYFVPADNPESAVPKVLELVRTRIPRRFGLDPVRDIQVLCPMNRGGGCESECNRNTPGLDGNQP